MGWEHFAGHCYLALDQVDQHDDVWHDVDDAWHDVDDVDLDYGGV